ncbi:uncharacterized protein N7496_004513 [Penicillium cataractarum]|uniref:Uncharacterized protein n=1 Tax=Penicillium cataractarum TaxID=2100454 RepID=A0A9W9SPA3_9EURO|nr:uncharacterized protein N7496_004513 [Penicillium cataractarum]KAJ5382085.1 hypothetical protein N7496_004513 [Penicillium cataractarum]
MGHADSFGKRPIHDCTRWHFKEYRWSDSAQMWATRGPAYVRQPASASCVLGKPEPTALQSHLQSSHRRAELGLSGCHDASGPEGNDLHPCLVQSFPEL